MHSVLRDLVHGISGTSQVLSLMHDVSNEISPSTSCQLLAVPQQYRFGAVWRCIAPPPFKKYLRASTPRRIPSTKYQSLILMSSLSVSDLTKLQTVKYVNLGSFAILAFDYCITFSEEVQWTWFKPWDVTRVIFIISRYLPFAGAGMTAYDALRVSNQCTSILEGNIIHLIGIVAAEALLVIRTWAFWQRSKRLMIGLLVYSVLTITAAIAADLSPTMLIPGEEPPKGTYYFQSTRNSAVVYIFLAMFESLLLVLTVYKRVHDYRDFQGGIVQTLYYDGMIYMLCILTITIANVIIGVALASAYSNMFDTLQIVSHSVLASRILFRIRHNNERVHETSMTVPTLDSMNYLRPSLMSTSGTGTTRSEV